jgi:hypothetical protein
LPLQLLTSQETLIGGLAGWLAISHRKWDSKVQTSVGQFSLYKEPPVTRLTSLGKRVLEATLIFVNLGHPCNTTLKSKGKG